jgi:hypothetical protein
MDQRFRSYLEIKTEDEKEIIAKCPFHIEQKASFTIRKEDDVFNCFGCEVSGRGFLSFFAQLYSVSKLYAGDYLEKPPSRVPNSDIDSWHKNLIRNLPLLQGLEKERGLNLETVKKYKLGWEGKSLCIPIRGIEFFINVRKKSKDSLFSYGKGYGYNQLFPLENLKKDPIIIFEGEPDTLLANQLGLPGITFTLGASNFNDALLSCFENKEVYICYDIDKAGKEGAEQLSQALLNYTRKVKIIHLPITTPENGDFSDYILLHKKKAEDIWEFIGEDEEAVDVISLDKIDYIGMNTRFACKAHIRGRASQPGVIPESIKLSCPLRKDQRTYKICGTCGLQYDGQVKIDGRDVVRAERFLDLTERETQREWERSLPFRLPPCPRRELSIVEGVPVRRVSIIPAFELSESSENLTEKRAYIIERNRVEGNVSYFLEGKQVMHPDGIMYPLFNKANPLAERLNTFRLSEEQIDKMRDFFSSKSFQEIEALLSKKVCKIYKRNKLVSAMDICYHSPLSFRIGGRRVEKGVIELLVIGDTRTGKSEVARSLSVFYNLGDMITGENASYAGLVGGISDANQYSKFISWGKLPLNNKRLLIIDEANDMSDDVLPKLSGIRSNGIAEVTKILSERTQAKVRIIWIANPPSGKSLRDFGMGFDAVVGWMKRGEDIARLDLIVGTSNDKIDMEALDKWKMSLNFEEIKERDLFRSLIHWIWSRKEEQVVFTEAARKYLLVASRKLSKKYSSEVKLMDGPETLDKIAKIAAAIAGRLFSTEDGQILSIKESHVKEAEEFIQECLDDNTLDYDAYAERTSSIVEAPGEVVELEEALRISGVDAKVLNQLLSKNNRPLLKYCLSNRDMRIFLAEGMNMPEEVLRLLLTRLTSVGLLKMTSRGVQITKALQSLLKNLLLPEVK